MSNESIKKGNARWLTWFSLLLVGMGCATFIAVFLVDTTDPTVIMWLYAISFLFGFAGRKVGYIAKKVTRGDYIPDDQWFARAIRWSDTLMVVSAIFLATMIIGSLIGFIQYQNSIK
jgi:hypothetical protein